MALADPFFAVLAVIIARFTRFLPPDARSLLGLARFLLSRQSFLSPLVRIGWIGRWMKSELIWKKYEILPRGEKPDKTLLNSESSVDKAN